MGGVLLALGLVGAPEARGAEAPSGGVTVAYPVPAGAPTGEVAVLSLGVAELPVASLIGTEGFVHMRVAAFNREDPREWVLDSRDQVLNLANGTTLAARYALAGQSAGPPRVVLPRGQRGYLDLFFAVDGIDVPWTSLTWRLRRGGGEIIVATTVFELLPEVGSGYAHLRPAQYDGGVLWVGSSWCEPRWGAGGGWLHPYGRYRRYRYTNHPGGFDVFDGRTRWRYERTPVAHDTVGGRWRGRSPAAPAAVARPASTFTEPVAGRRQPLSAPSPAVARPVSGFRAPAPAAGKPAPTAAVGRPVSGFGVPSAPREHFSWRLKVEHLTGGSGGGGSRASDTWSSTGDSWRSRSAPSSSDSSPSSSSSSLSSPSSSSPSSSDSSSSSSKSSSSSPSSSSSGSVGSHWRR